MPLNITGIDVIDQARKNNKHLDTLDTVEQTYILMDTEATMAEQHAKAVRLKLNRMIWMANRAKLCRTLRDPAQWPKKFKWDFRAPDNCGMGMARKMGFFDTLSDDALQKTFGLTAEDVRRVFVYPRGGAWEGECTPEDVATALERVG